MSLRDDFGGPLLGLVFFLLLFGTCRVTCGLPEAKVVQVLEDQGFTDVKPGGYSYFGCAEDDVFRSSFTAVGPSGKVVEGHVCCGLLKDCTVRTK